ncbi:NADH dehydrogenase [ubiquinone] 1 alpha subcomplex assembly factor 2 [Agrilus planipennis]|uniref:NADH dehydrogenase [ubiquinone] 1 alpha subcomplex assembly factor 2 n=1 Tax=Agrilus planipennis TaxID=224129 RepID=A0A1W4X6C5_AGRPL|nr:NADH dehydrogenase [ubiquinone] 1 alpha subcomplex assembly factor 2 [Agrilus planipennis]
MAKPPPRSIITMIITNFVNSLKPKKTSGNFKGIDYMGNNYYEIPADPSIGKRQDKRWFVPQNSENFEDVPPEWDSWLRGRRKEPPTEEEIMKNLAIIEIKRKNAIEVEKKAGKPSQMITGYESFPKRPEYEIFPGEHSDKGSTK